MKYIIYLFFFSQILFCQNLDWQPVEKLNSKLPLSIRVFSAQNDMTPIRAWYVDIDLRKHDMEMQAVLAENSKRKQPVTRFAKEHDAFVAINAGYFGVSKGQGISYSFIANNKKILSNNVSQFWRKGIVYYPTRSIFVVDQFGVADIFWGYKFQGDLLSYTSPSPIREGQTQPQPHKTFPTLGTKTSFHMGVGGGPMLVYSRLPSVTWEQEVFFGSGIGNTTQKQPRTALGYTPDQHLLIVVVDGRQTSSAGISLIELADIFVNLGAEKALNLDGGGSSTLVINGDLINRPQGGEIEREVASAIVIVPKTSF
ncbi:phosphodiester glycosidase family protein [Candidatus Uabimicrobium amorphum]|uniref:Exopolysaccharide biosynthesis protein n=1 Tax=Uabimicrobium amorphum TaxID=2596890 RepID=A0A5S9IQL8_UABAM|nr:phosphodiester glycosidase family protein [Candidatus Uabimicrobium amorphum]BBM85370.1 exopolysaccharide biosynthesis protein [Candidatus Uabimicrobium amorphum]